jgi:ribokinase
MTRIVVVGSLNRDYVCHVEQLPGPGETRLGGELALFSGGKGGNQAVAAAAVGSVTGHPCSLVGSVGDDEDGRALLADLRGSGVDVREVAVTDRVRTGAALITVSADGENTIVVAPGANHSVTEPAVADAFGRVLAADDVVVIQAELPLAVVQTAVREAAAGGARVVLNLAPFTALPDDVLALCDPLVVNESEAAGLLGVSVDGVAGARTAAAALAGTARSAVVTTGAAGAVVAAGTDCTHVPAPKVDVVDSTGAGDAFTGALAVALAAGRDLVTAARWGIAVASYSVCRPGAQASYPRGEDCAGLLREIEGQTGLAGDANIL